MIHVCINQVIDQPIEAVFDRLVDIDHYRDWMPQSGLFRESRQITDGPVEKGTEFVDDTVLGRFEGRVEEYQRPNLVAFRQVLHRRRAPVFISKPSYILQPTAAGAATLVRHRAEGQLRGLYRVLRPLAHLIAFRERGRTLEGLARSFDRRTS